MSDDHGTLGAGLVSTEALGEAGAGAPSDAERPAVPAPTAPDHLICPGCQHSVPTGDFQSGSVRCDHCGNTFRLERMQHGVAIDKIRLVGRFQLLDRVGQGSFGTVWRARDTQLDRVVALKIPHEYALAAGLDADRLAREARIAAQLRHSGIVRLYEILTVENIPVLVSDFIDGIPLKEWLEKRRLTFRETALLVAQIAEALDHAHEHGLVHRDVKPANIMIEKVRPSADRAGASGAEPAGGRLGQPIVVDFGLAVRPEADTVMTLEGQIVGTPAYMSPEQAAGRVHDVDRRSDIYSLGVVLYQLLCGELPFRGSKVMLIHQVLHEDPRPPRRVNDRIPRDLETICLKALAKSPSRRYATARELADDLHRFVRGEPCRARPVGRVERGWLWTMRNKALAGAIGLAAVLLSATVVVSLFAAVREKRHAEQLRVALREANHRLAENYLNRGLTLCERGDVAHGLLLLARALTAVPDDVGDLGRTVRTNLAGWQEELDPLVTQRRHGDWVTAATFSPDGTLAATGGRDHMVRLWKGAQAEPLGGPIDCTDEVRSLAFSPDGAALAIVGRNDKVRFWDIRRAQFSPTVVAHGPRVYAMAYSHSGKVLATGGADRQVRFWDPADGRPLPLVLPHAAPASMVAFAPDDQTILTATEEGEIRLWDAKSGAQRARSSDHVRKSLLTGALGPNGRWLATAGKDWSVRIWDAASLELVHELPHPGLVRAIAFGPGGRILLTAATDKVARLWDVRSGAGLGPAAYHQQGVGAVAFSPDGSRLLTGSDDGVCQFRRSRMADPRCLELVHRAGVGVVGFSPDGRVALTGTKPYDATEGDVQLWDVATGRRLERVTHSKMVTAAIFSADGRILATASADGTARLMDVATGKALCPPLRHEQWVHAIAFNPQGTRLLTACEDCAARLWDVPTGRYLERSFAHEQPVVAVAFSPDGTLVLTGSADGTARLWDVASGRERHVFRHREFVRSVAFSPDGKTALTASLDHTARLWQVDSGQPIGKPLVHQDEVLCAAFGPDGETILTGSRDNTAQLWRAATTAPLGSPMAHHGPVYAVAYSPDRATVATASGDATVQCWDIGTSQPLGPALRHRGPISTVAFSPDGRLVITGSQDRTARIWQAPRTFDASPSHVEVWIQTLCGMRLAANEALALLTLEEWQQCCQQLRELGGPPIAESR